MKYNHRHLPGESAQLGHQASGAGPPRRSRGWRERMKVRWPFVLCGFLTTLVTLVSFHSPTSPSEQTEIVLLAYTNQSGTSLALLQVTNRTASTFTCLVSPRAVTFRGRREIWCASTHVLSPRGAFVFSVQTATNDKARRVSVRLVETRGWQVALASMLLRFGIHAFKGKDYQLTSSAFSRPTTHRNRHPNHSSQQPLPLPLPEVAGDSQFPGFNESWLPGALAERDH